MSLLSLQRGPEVNLPSAINNGTIWLCTDTGNFYIDIDGKRIWPNHGVMSGASAHNKIFRGKYLGTSITADQYAAIADGSFNNMYIGDYWEIDSKKVVIGGFDYYLDYPASGVTQHHILAFTGGDYGPYHSSNTIKVAYANASSRRTLTDGLSTMFGSHLGTFNTTITNALTEAHSPDSPLECSVIQVTTTSEMFKGCMVMNSDQISNYNSFKEQVVLDSIIEKSVVPYFQDLPGRLGSISESNYPYANFFLQDFCGYNDNANCLQAVMDTTHVLYPDSEELGYMTAASDPSIKVVNYFLII